MDKDMLKLISLKTGLSLNYISKEDRISQLLSQLSIRFPKNTILKGGTALNRVYLQKTNVNRFSEDIDLDYISGDSLDSKIRHIRKSMQNINNFDISAGKLMHRTLRFDCKYTNDIGHRDLVRTEFYLSHAKPLTSQPPGMEPLNSSFVSATPVFFRTYSFEDLLARKIVALYNRTEGKDIYDTFYALDMDYSRHHFREALSQIMEFYKIDLDTRTFYRQLIEKLKHISANSTYIRDSTNHYIPSIQRPDWNILIDSLISKLEAQYMSSN